MNFPFIVTFCCTPATTLYIENIFRMENYKPSRTIETLRRRKVAFMASCLIIASMLLGACSGAQAAPVKIKPYSVENYCSKSSLTLKTSSGINLTGPESCGTGKNKIEITAPQISPIAKTESLLGRAYLTPTLQTEDKVLHIGGVIDEILINEDLPLCMLGIIKRKEWDDNAAVTAFASESGVLNYFAGQDAEGPFLAVAGYTYVDATTIHETMSGLTSSERDCMHNYEPGTFSESFFAMVDATPNLASLTADGEFSQADFCTTLTSAINYTEYIQTDSDAQAMSALADSLNCKK
jgi:hypothetical protein